MSTSNPGPIGVFDSGYGGLTILSAFRKLLPQYDYIYLGDNARAPYGSRSFDVVYDFTLQAVKALFDRGCHLVILACNTASAKALRTIQQNDLPRLDPSRRVLGVIRPTVEALGNRPTTGSVCVVGTPGTVMSHSYQLEIAKLYPHIKVTETPCPLWVPLIENREADSPGADYFVKKYLGQTFAEAPDADTLILACTHYPLLLPKIKEHTPPGVRILCQGDIVATSLADYLERHPEMKERCSTGGSCTYLTTENPIKFSESASVFLGTDVTASHITLH